MLTLIAALVGALVGAVSTGIAYRLSVELDEPARSVCDRCGATLPGLGEPSNRPGRLASWFRIPYRCGSCRARLGYPTWVGAALGVVGFGSVAWALGLGYPLAAALVVAGFGLPLGMIDLACQRLPDPLVAAAAVGTAAVILLSSVLTGSYGPLLRGLIVGAVFFGGWVILGILPGSRLGFGDVKLAGVLGLLLGYLGWGYVLVGAMLPHLLNLPAVAVMAVRRRHGWKSDIPLGPSLLAGTVLAIPLIVAISRWEVR